MKIAVLSDTHIPRNATEVPAKVLAGITNCDMILHCGDLVELSVIAELEKLANVYAVQGNMDEPEVKKALPEKRVIKVGGFKIGLVHGRGHPDKVASLIKDDFEDVDVICFGHSHRPMNEVIGGVLFFNPGSVTDNLTAPYNSYGILEVGKGIKGKIVKI